MVVVIGYRLGEWRHDVFVVQRLSDTTIRDFTFLIFGSPFARHEDMMVIRLRRVELSRRLCRGVESKRVEF